MPIFVFPNAKSGGIKILTSVKKKLFFSKKMQIHQMFNKDIDLLHKPEIDSSLLTEIFLQGLCHKIFTSCLFIFFKQLPPNPGCRLFAHFGHF